MILLLESTFLLGITFYLSLKLIQTNIAKVFIFFVAVPTFFYN